MQDFQETPSPEDGFEVEVSAIGADGAGDSTPIVRAPLTQGRLHQARTRRLMLLGCALIAALAVLASIPSLRSQALSLFGGAASPTPGSSSFPYASLTPQPTPGPGWILAGPHNAAMIAFAPSAPATAYTCGPQHASGDQSVPISFGVSYNSGSTWQTLSTPATGISCDLTINPTNAQDVVLLAVLPCDQCTWTQAARLYRTFDGGKHSSAWSLPPTSSNQASDLLYCQWIWIGSTLFIAPFLAGDIRYVRLAASVAERPFIWIKTAGLFDGAPTDASINGLFVAGTTLYVQLFSQKCTSNCDWFMQSHDNGVSWSQFNPTVQGRPVSLMAVGGDGRMLLGQMVQPSGQSAHAYGYSRDEGNTWTALPPAPEGLVAGLITATPDGTVYAGFDQDFSNPENGPPLGIYKVVPGATAWHDVAPLPPGSWFVACWDAAGHPVALWGRVDPTALSSGMERHQP